MARATPARCPLWGRKVAFRHLRAKIVQKARRNDSVSYNRIKPNLGQVARRCRPKWTQSGVADFAVHVVAHLLRDQNPPDFGHFLQTGSKVYAVAKQIVALDDDVIQMHPKPEWEQIIAPVQNDLNVDGTAHGAHNRRKLCYQPIPGRIGNAPACLRNGIINDRPGRAQGTDRSLFVTAHPARVIGGVGGQYRGQFPVYGARLGHEVHIHTKKAGRDCARPKNCGLD
ncbi:MAG: hypothetical protein AAFS01_11085 [Pseudomonadota bacterium]